MTTRNRGFVKRAKNHFQSKTMDGLVEIAPTIITIIVVVALVGYADTFIRPHMANVPPVQVLELELSLNFPGVGIVIGIIVSYIIGLFISSRIGMSCMRGIDRLMLHIPFVKSVFGVSRQIMTSMTSQYNFSRVVFIEWPRENMIAMGFVTGRAYSERTGESLAVVYVPTVPNPTSGNMALVLEDHIIETDMSVEDAMKLVFSGGISLPEDFALARVPFEHETPTFDSYGGFRVEKSRQTMQADAPKS